MADSTGRDIRTLDDIGAPKRPRLRIGSRLPESAYAGNTLLLRAGAVIESYSQLIRLMQPDVRFGLEGLIEISFGPRRRSAIAGLEAAKFQKPKDLEARVHRALALKAEALKDVASMFRGIEATGEVDVALAQRTVSSLVNELLGDNFTLASLAQVKNADAYTLSHSVNVCILAMCIARMLGCEETIHEIGTGALLHDVGKVKTPASILRKAGPLDESEVNIIRRHPTEGGRLILSAGHPGEISLACILDHHERMSGGGYPHGKRADNLSLYAQITALADVYDALTTDRPYRRALKPQDALSLMVREMRGELEDELLHHFAALVGYVADEEIIRPYVNSMDMRLTDPILDLREVTESSPGRIVRIDTYR